MNMNKTVEDRVSEAFKLAEEHYGEGEVLFVGVKFMKNKGWVAKISFEDSRNGSLVAVNATNAKIALKDLRNRLRSMIQRRELV